MRALYDYEAMNDDEISFKEGDIVGVLSKDDNEIDDGFWYGEFQGHRGVFPSLVVEDMPDGFHVMDTNMNVTDSLRPSSTLSNNTRDGDYVTLPLDYRAASGPAPASNALQPVRRAPPPPASSPQIPRSTTMASGGARALLPPVDRQRAKTENTTTMRKPDNARSITYHLDVNFTSNPPSPPECPGPLIPNPLEFPIPSMVGVWIFSGNTHSVLN